MAKRVDEIGCISIVPFKKWHNFSTLNPHVYTEIVGKKVEILLDPGHEVIYCENSARRLIMPVNISRIRKGLCRRANPQVIYEGKVEEDP